MTDLTLQKNNDGIHIYVRSFSNQTETICQQLNDAYGGHSVLSTSGIHAISTVTRYALSKNMWNKLNVICGDEMYCDTKRVFKELGKFYKGINCQEVNVCNDNDIISAVAQEKKSFCMLFLESCTNPSGQVFNFDLIKTLKKNNPNLLVVIDNTWLTHVIFNPFEYGADIVIQSMSKHYSGGNCISGAIITKYNKSAKQISNMYRYEGIHFSTAYGDIIVNNLPLLESRIKILSDTTKKLLKLFQDKGKDINIIHPYLQTHKSYDMANKYFKNGLVPGIILLELNVPKNIAVALMVNSNIPYKTSFGGAVTKFDPWPFEVNGHTFCRLSIGYDESYEHIEKVLIKFIESYETAL